MQMRPRQPDVAAPDWRRVAAPARIDDRKMRCGYAAASGSSAMQARRRPRRACRCCGDVEHARHHRHRRLGQRAPRLDVNLGQRGAGSPAREGDDVGEGDLLEVVRVIAPAEIQRLDRAAGCRSRHLRPRPPPTRRRPASGRDRSACSPCARGCRSRASRQRGDGAARRSNVSGSSTETPKRDANAGHAQAHAPQAILAARAASRSSSSIESQNTARRPSTGGSVGPPLAWAVEHDARPASSRPPAHADLELADALAQHARGTRELQYSGSGEVFRL